MPRAAHVFVPPYADSAREFVSYGYTSQEVYGYAYRSLKRRMGVLGLECPPPEDLRHTVNVLVEAAEKRVAAEEMKAVVAALSVPPRPAPPAPALPGQAPASDAPATQ